jgi:hypothetical protein
MRLLRTFLLSSAILVAPSSMVAQVGPQSGTSGESPVLSIRISAEHASVKLGSPIRLNVMLMNTSNHDVNIVQSLKGGEYKVDMRDADGKLARDSSFGYIHNGHIAQTDMEPSRISSGDLADSLVGGLIKAHDTMPWVLTATRFYEISQPGKYAIQIERPDPENPSVSVKSNTITVTVTQ